MCFLNRVLNAGELLVEETAKFSRSINRGLRMSAFTGNRGLACPNPFGL